MKADGRRRSRGNRKPARRKGFPVSGITPECSAKPGFPPSARHLGQKIRSCGRKRRFAVHFPALTGISPVLRSRNRLFPREAGVFAPFSWDFQRRRRVLLRKTVLPAGSRALCSENGQFPASLSFYPPLFQILASGCPQQGAKSTMIRVSHPHCPPPSDRRNLTSDLQPPTPELPWPPTNSPPTSTN